MLKHNSIRSTRQSFGLLSLVVWAVFALAVNTLAQSPSPTPAAENTVWGYKITAAGEFGYRWRSVDGNENKYNSDLNYQSGFRTFDSNILFQSDTGKGKPFDSLLISNSGWGSDPNGYLRVNAEKIGFYKANGNVRRVSYYNNLLNHALNQHTQNVTHNFGDVDLTLLPENETIRFSVGASFGNLRGPGTWTTRGGTSMSDEFPVSSFTRNRADDYRFGVEGKLLGFNWGINQGFRVFTDRSNFVLKMPHPGNNTGNTVVLTSFSRDFPTDGNTSYTNFFLQRTFAKRLDFSGRLVYANTRSEMSMFELLSGRNGNNEFVDVDSFSVTSKAKRLQTRADVGLTYMATDKFRISNTFNFDQFSISGDERLQEALYRRTPAGVPIAPTFPLSTGYRTTDYHRYVNTIEGDYQFNLRFALHLGYRFTHRTADIVGIDRTLTSPPSTSNPLFKLENEVNSTHALIIGGKVKPTANWVIFSDFERGTADNVFTSNENYEYTNFRFRTRYAINNFVLNASVITRDNDNPSSTLNAPANVDFTTNIKSRNYSTSVDWTPNAMFTISGGYTYLHLTSYTPIFLPLNSTLVPGTSQYYGRDQYGFVDVVVRPLRRLSFYGSYRIDDDNGQGSRVPTLPQNLIGGYPMQFVTPEFRAVIQLTNYIDWNIGYHYYKYNDTLAPQQNYRAHLPFTSLRVYFGGRAVER